MSLCGQVPQHGPGVRLPGLRAHCIPARGPTVPGRAPELSEPPSPAHAPLAVRLLRRRLWATMLTMPRRRFVRSARAEREQARLHQPVPVLLQRPRSSLFAFLPHQSVAWVTGRSNAIDSSSRASATCTRLPRPTCRPCDSRSAGQYRDALHRVSLSTRSPLPCCQPFKQVSASPLRPGLAPPWAFLDSTARAQALQQHPIAAQCARRVRRAPLRSAHHSSRCAVRRFRHCSQSPETTSRERASMWRGYAARHGMDLPPVLCGVMPPRRTALRRPRAAPETG